MPVKSVTAVILKGYPRLSETFIAQELLALERAGHDLILFSMRHPTDKTAHPVHREIKAPVVYLPEYLHAEPLRVAKALVRLLPRRAFWRAAAAFLQDLRGDFTRNRWRRFGQGCVLAAELPPEVTRLYAHFIHTPAAVTRYASLISGLDWTCSAHAKDIWTSSERDLRTSIASARWIATCTAVGHARLAALSDVPGKVHLIYHGLDLDRFPSPPQQAERRDGTDPAAPVRLMSVGRAVEKKGFDTLVAALAKLPDTFHWTFTHIGGGTRLSALKAQAEALGLTSRISWLGARDQAEVLALYRSSDLFVLPSRVAADGDRDGLPNVLVEAQSQRLAAIATPVSAIPELIVDGENGLLVPPDDPQALADAILKLGRAPELRQRLGAAGEARVRTEFDAHRTIRVLDDLFSGRHAVGGGRATVTPARVERLGPGSVPSSSLRP